MDRPVIIGNVHNISLESLSDESDEYPHLVAQFSCETEVHNCIHFYTISSPHGFKVCCAAIWLHDMYNVTVKRMSIAVQTSSVSGIILTNVSGIAVQLNTTCFLTDHNTIGITIYDATSFGLYLSNVSNCSYGLVLHNTTNTDINKVAAMYNEWEGITSRMATNTHISNITTVRNGGSGMFLTHMNNTHIANITSSHNVDGMFMQNMNNTNITNTIAVHNIGHGLHFITMSNTHISNTVTTHNGDGIESTRMSNTYMINMAAAYNHRNGMWLFHMSNTHITSTFVTQNGLLGMYLEKLNDTYITQITTIYNGDDAWEGNTAQIVILSSTNTLIYNTSFTDISFPSASTTVDPTSLPAVIFLNSKSTLHVSRCMFTGNSISALKAHSSNITVSGTVTFSNNTAFAGPAFVLTGGSILTSANNSHTYFLNNHATNIGGVFYVTDNNVKFDSSDIKRSTCFLSTEGTRTQTRFTFVNNSAAKGGDLLYGEEILLGLDENSNRNCLDSFKSISNILQNGLSLISSDPLRVCLCNGSGQPDCLLAADRKPHSIYSGQTINISAVVVGQNFGTVAGFVYAQFLQNASPPQLESGQKVQSITQHKCNPLYYTIFSQSELSTSLLVLTARDSYVSDFNDIDNPGLVFALENTYATTAATAIVYANNPVYVNVSLLPCPPGFMLTTHTPFRCDCNSLLQQMYGIKCHIQEQTIGRSGLLWVGVIQDDNGTNETVAASEYCPLNYCSGEDSNVTLSEPDSQCNYNHSGTLCGGCQPGLSLALGSAQCLQCSNKYLALLIPLTLAGPGLVFSIKLLDLTISQGTLNGLIFYANVVKANEFVFLPRKQTNPLTVFIAWLNLDLGVETCLFSGLTAYSKTWLQFVFPFYIWCIAGLIIILAKYSDRVAKVMGNNSVPVLATLFLLSYAKSLHTIITVLSYTMVYTSHGPKAVWTADGNVDYLGPQHAPLFATAVAVLLFLWLPYTLLLFLGQRLQKFNCRLLVHALKKVKPFLDAHYSLLKNKHHYWFGALLLVRATILVISALVPANHSSIIVLCVLITSVVLTYFGHLVYHNLAVVMFDLSFFMNLAILSGAHSFTTTAGGGVAVPAYTLIGVALAQFVGLVIFKVFSILKQSEKVMQCLHKEQPFEDNRELHEQAAVQREMESDAEEQDSIDCESIESLPTYLTVTI